MKKLETHQEIKDYVIRTIKLRDKKRIIEVMEHYKQWLKNHDKGFKNSAITDEDINNIFGDVKKGGD